MKDLNTLKNRISPLLRDTLIMTAVNLLMRSAAVSFNAFLTGRIGSAGMDLYQLMMTVYGLAVTFASAGIRLASTRVTVEIEANGRQDLNGSFRRCLLYALVSGSAVGLLLFQGADFAALRFIGDAAGAKPLRILALSLPFVAMSAALGGYFTGRDQVPQYAGVQLAEQAAGIGITVALLNRYAAVSAAHACLAVVTGTTLAELLSFLITAGLRRLTLPPKTDLPRVKLRRILRVALPDAAGTCARSLLLTIEHLLIPKSLQRSGAGSEAALAAYGAIHAVVLPVLLYPAAIVNSLSALLVPTLARQRELGDRRGVSRTVTRWLRRTLLFPLLSAACVAAAAPLISGLIYGTPEIVVYLRILAPLIPLMYMDNVTDGMLKGLDEQVASMRYNVIDSALCVVLVRFLLPVSAVKGYLFILYISELFNFYLSFRRLITVCEIPWFSSLRARRAPRTEAATFAAWSRGTAAREACGSPADPGRRKRSPDRAAFR
ncbi:MAG: oligosaccharide flippase family protein [Clostridia bacterium]|nr:oligosaccharide flippase family protein [Clostridia bacterium]